MIQLIRIGTMITLLVLLFSSHTEANNPGFTNVQPGELENLLNDREVVIIDVRTPGEWEQGKVEEALTINLYDQNFRQQIGELDPDANYLIYCNSGGRSRIASGMMLEMGFKNIFNYDGSHTRIRHEYQQVGSEDD